VASHRLLSRAGADGGAPSHGAIACAGKQASRGVRLTLALWTRGSSLPDFVRRYCLLGRAGGRRLS
jgi:hypothetical protein